MPNPIKIQEYNIDTSGVYDLTEQKTQRAINADLKGAITSVENKFPVSVANGGTGATTAKQAVINLGATPELWQVFSRSGGAVTNITEAAISNRSLADFDFIVIVCKRIISGSVYTLVGSLFNTVAGFKTNPFKFTEVSGQTYEATYIDDTHVSISKSADYTQIFIYGFGTSNTY